MAIFDELSSNTGIQVVKNTHLHIICVENKPTHIVHAPPYGVRGVPEFRHNISFPIYIVCIITYTQ